MCGNRYCRRVTDPRHPQDPDPARASKASAVLGLGVVAVLTGPLVGGVIPATIALLLARESRRDLVSAQGFLLGRPAPAVETAGRWLPRPTRLRIVQAS